jgi:hypothetical protein
MMGEYLSSVTMLAIILDLLEALSAERYKTLTRAAVSIILVIAIITPIPSLMGKFRGELDFSLDNSIEGEDIRLASFEEGVARYIASEFNLAREDVEVEAIKFSPTEMKAEKILIILSGKAVTANYKKIERDVGQLGIGEAEVKIEI